MAGPALAPHAPAVQSTYACHSPYCVVQPYAQSQCRHINPRLARCRVRGVARQVGQATVVADLSAVVAKADRLWRIHQLGWRRRRQRDWWGRLCPHGRQRRGGRIQFGLWRPGIAAYSSHSGASAGWRRSLSRHYPASQGWRGAYAAYLRPDSKSRCVILSPH